MNKHALLGLSDFLRSACRLVSALDLIQDWRARLASGEQSVIIPPGVHVIDEPLRPTEGQTILLLPGCELQAAKTGFAGVSDPLIDCSARHDITIIGHVGSRICMHRDKHGEPSEARHAIKMTSATNILLEGLTIRDAGGDGVKISGLSENITIRDCNISGCWRNAITIGAGRNILIEGCDLQGSEGIWPESGLCIEPANNNYRLDNIVVRDCDITSERAEGMKITLGHHQADDPDVNIRVENCRLSSQNSNQFGLIVAYVFCPGSIDVIDCEIPAMRVWNKRPDSAPMRVVGGSVGRLQLTNSAYKRFTVGGIAFENVRPGGVECFIRKGTHADDLESSLDAPFWENIQGVGVSP